MRALLFALLFVPSAMANICNSDLTMTKLFESEEAQGYLYQANGSSNVDLSEEEFSKLPHLGQLDYKFCKDYLSEMSFYNTKTGESYKVIYSWEDSCDGGNTVGDFFEESGKYIGVVGDGEFYCN